MACSPNFTVHVPVVNWQGELDGLHLSLFCVLQLSMQLKVMLLSVMSGIITWQDCWPLRRESVSHHVVRVT